MTRGSQNWSSSSRISTDSRPQRVSVLRADALDQLVPAQLAHPQLLPLDPERAQLVRVRRQLPAAVDVDHVLHVRHLRGECSSRFVITTDADWSAMFTLVLFARTPPGKKAAKYVVLRRWLKTAMSER